MTKTSFADVIAARFPSGRDAISKMYALASAEGLQLASCLYSDMGAKISKVVRGWVYVPAAFG